MSIPIITGSHIKYVTAPVGCKLVYATYTTTNTETFSSVRLYISTIALETINSFGLKQEDGMDLFNLIDYL